MSRNRRRRRGNPSRAVGPVESERERAVRTTKCPTCDRAPGRKCIIWTRGRLKPTPHATRVRLMQETCAAGLDPEVMVERAKLAAGAEGLAGVDLGALFNIDLVRS